MATPAIATDAAGITGNGARHVASVVEQLPVDVLYDHPDNPRGQAGDVDELAASVKANGILEPLLVVPGPVWQRHDDRLPFLTGTDFVIVAGHRRKAAAVQAGLTAVPCIVRDDLAGADAAVAMLVENLQREDLTPLQEANGYAKLEAQGKSQREIARLVGRTQPHISKRLSLLKLPDDVAARIGLDDDDGITVDEAVTAARYADEPDVLRAVLNRRAYQSAEQVAEATRARTRRAAELEAECKKWRARVQKLVEWKTWGLGPYDSPRRLEHLASDGVDIDEHEHFACHAMAVGHDMSGNLHAEAVCINPKAHPESRENRESEAKRKAAAKIERDKAAAAKRAAARREKLAELLKPKKLPADLVALAERRLVEDLVEQVYDRAEWLVLGELLGLPAPAAAHGDADEQERDDRAADHYRDQLPGYLDAGHDSVHRALVAATLVQLDATAEGGSWYGDAASRRCYLQTLAAHGYKLSGPEMKLAEDGEA